MNNWRLLLLAVVVVVQPIGSFTESNLFDGRECCERTQDDRVYGTDRRLLDGNREDRRTNDRRLKQPDEYRSSEHGSLVSRVLEPSRHNRSPALRREVTRDIRQDQNRRDVFRSSMVQTERDSRESKSRDALDVSHRLSGMPARDLRHQPSRESMPRLQIRNSRNLEERDTTNKETVARRQEREIVIRSSIQRDTRLGHARADFRIVQEKREMSDRSYSEHRIQENGETRRFANGIRDNVVRVQRVQVSREVRDREFVRSDVQDRDMAHQREFQARLSSVEFRRESPTERNAEERGQSSQQRRDSKGISRYAERMERRTESLDRRFDIADRASQEREEISNKIRQPFAVRTNAMQNEERIGNDRLIASGRFLTRQDTRESTEERERLERDNTKLQRQISAKLSRERHTDDSRKPVRERSDQRQQREVNRESRVLETRNQRSMDKTISMSRSAQRTQDMRVSRYATNIRKGSRSNDEVQRHLTGEPYRSLEQRMSREALSERVEVRLSRSEKSRSERIGGRGEARGINVREITDRVERNTRNADTPKRIDNRRSTRTENIRMERLVRDHQDLQNDRRDVQREREETRSSRRLSERIQLVSRQENRENKIEISRNSEIRDKTLDSRGQRDASFRTSERTTERMQGQRGISRLSRNVIIRNRAVIRNEQRDLSQRRQQSREELSRNMREESRVVETQRSEGNRITRDNRNEINLKARQTLLARNKDNREVRVTKRENKDDATKRNVDARMQRQMRVSERSTERKSDSETRKEVRLNRSNDRRESGNIFRANAEERMETVAHTAQRVDIAQEKRQDNFRNLYGTHHVSESDDVVSNWKMALYTLQGIYLCGLVVQMLTQNENKIKKRTSFWWSSPKYLIKAE